MPLNTARIHDWVLLALQARGTMFHDRPTADPRQATHDAHIGIQKDSREQMLFFVYQLKEGAYPVTAKQLVKMLTTTAPIIIPIMNSKKRPLSEAAVTKVVELSSSRVIVETLSCLSFLFPLSQGCLKS